MPCTCYAGYANQPYLFEKQIAKFDIFLLSFLSMRKLQVVPLFCQTWGFLFSWKSAERMFMTHLGGNEDLLHTTFGTLKTSHIWEVNKPPLFPMLSWAFKRETMCVCVCCLGEVGRDQQKKIERRKKVMLMCRCCEVMKLSPQKPSPEISGSRVVIESLSLHWALWPGPLHPPTCRTWITVL